MLFVAVLYSTLISIALPSKYIKTIVFVYIFLTLRTLEQALRHIHGDLNDDMKCTCTVSKRFTLDRLEKNVHEKNFFGR